MQWGWAYLNLGELMARLEFGVPVPLDGQVWFLTLKGLSVQQDVLIHLGDRAINASSGQLKHSGIDSVWQLNADATIFHIDLNQVSQSEPVQFSIVARESAFVSWSLRNPLGAEYQIDGLEISRGAELEILELRKNSETGAEVIARNQLPSSEHDSAIDNRLPQLVRESQAIAKSLGLGSGFDSVVGIVDTTASMREQLNNGTLHKVLEAIRGISSSITMSPFQLFFAGIPTPAEVWTTTDIPSLATGYSSRFDKNYIQIPPLLELVPDTLAGVQENSLVYVVSDCWFYVSQRTIQLLETKGCQLVLVQLLETSSDYHKIKFSHAQVATRPLIGFTAQTPVPRVLQGLAVGEGLG